MDAKDNKGVSPRDLLNKSSRNINDIMPKPTAVDAIKLAGGSPVFSNSAQETKDNNSSLRSSSSSSSSDSSDSDSDSDFDEPKHVAKP